MTPEQVKMMIRQELSFQGGSAQFNTTQIPHHTHNGKDAPFIFSPQQVYCGYANADGSLSRSEPFPQGWGASRIGTGDYQILHNLNTSFYVPIVQLIYNPANPPITALIHYQDSSRFQFYVQNASTGALVNSRFFFFLINVNNTQSGFPAYAANAV